MGGEDPGPRVAGLLLDVEVTLRRYGISASHCGAVRFRLTPRGDTFSVSRDERLFGHGVEELLRIGAQFGYDGREMVVDGVNVQVADGIGEEPPVIRVLDFGRYRMVHSFDTTLYSWSQAAFETLRGVVLRPWDPGYPQPCPEFSMSRMLDHPLHTALGEAVEDYQRGRADRSSLLRALNAFVAEAVSRLN